MANAVRRPPDKAMSAGGRFLPIMVTRRAGQIGCNRWSERMQMTGQVECRRVVKCSAISHLRSSEQKIRLRARLNRELSFMTAYRG